MGNGFLGVLSFMVGGVLGFVVADRMTKQKYEQLAQDEIDSVKAAFRRNHPKEEQSAAKPTESERKAYSQYANKLGYTKEDKPAPMQGPRVISPDAFGDQGEYDQISLTYYADGTVTDDNDRAMSEEEVEETIGKDSLTHFGEYEEDSVFVRNDQLKADYEILMDQRTYADVLREKPYLVK